MIGAVSGVAAAIVAASASGAPSHEEQLAGSFPIVELRQYTLHDGQRDTLIKLFEREFVESQEALGMKVIGTFRDLDRPNRFVWLRGFTDMDARLAGLSAFYSGDVWQAHRNEANATMIDSDNVLLLHAAVAGAAFKREPVRPARGEKREAHRIIATIYYLNGDSSRAARRFQDKVVPLLDTAAVPVLAWFIPEAASNNYPRLPVREGDRVLVWFTRFSSDADYDAHKTAMQKAAAELAPDLQREPEVLRLEPTDRSELR
jgi:quinol monooxygenase YgiN